MVNLLSMPQEILHDIAEHAEYDDAQELRLVCRRVNLAVERFALSNLTLDWNRTHEEFPLEMLLAYSTGQARATRLGYVRHLKLKRICLDFEEKESPFDCMLEEGPPKRYNSEGLILPSTTAKRITYFLTLMKDLFLQLHHLKTLTWHWSVCHSAHFSDVASYCAGLSGDIGGLLRSRGMPLTEVTIEMSEDMWPEISHHMMPPCKKLSLRGFEEYHDGTEVLELTWLADLILNMDHLKEFNTDVWLNEEFIEKMFPRVTDASRLSSPMPQCTRLCILHSGFEIGDHVFDQLRSLRQLEIRRNDEACSKSLYQRRLSEIYNKLTRLRIYVEDVWIHMEDIQDPFIDYIASFPRPTLKALELFRFGFEEYPDNSTAENMHKFFERALPVVAPGLRTFIIGGCDRDPVWVFNDLPQEYYATFQRCTSLRTLSVMLRSDPVQEEERPETIVRNVMRGHPYLHTVHLGVTRRGIIACTFKSI